MKACFIGHKVIKETEELKSSLRETILALIDNGVKVFLFGSGSAFDNLSWKIVTELKKDYPYIKRAYVRAVYQQITKSYEKYLLSLYEQTYFPEKIKNAGKYSYVERNYEMINSSTYCVFYYDKDYIPQPKQARKQDKTLSPTRNSGTKIAYEYALKNKKEIFNLCK